MAEKYRVKYPQTLPGASPTGDLSIAVCVSSARQVIPVRPQTASLGCLAVTGLPLGLTIHGVQYAFKTPSSIGP